MAGLRQWSGAACAFMCVFAIILGIEAFLNPGLGLSDSLAWVIATVAATLTGTAMAPEEYRPRARNLFIGLAGIASALVLSFAEMTEALYPVVGSALGGIASFYVIKPPQ